MGPKLILVVYTTFKLSHVRLVTIEIVNSKLDSILQVRTEPVICYAFNTVLLEFSENYIIVKSVKCLLQVKNHSTSKLPRTTALFNFFCDFY